MKAILNETRLRYCDLCARMINCSSRLRHTISKSHVYKKGYGIDVEEYELVRPEIDEVTYIHNDTIKDCRNYLFHSIEYRCEYDNKFIEMENNAEIILTDKLGYLKFKSQFF